MNLRDGGDLKVGDFIMIEMYIELLETVGSQYDNLFLKNYCTAEEYHQKYLDKKF